METLVGRKVSSGQSGRLSYVLRCGAETEEKTSAHIKTKMGLQSNQSWRTLLRTLSRRIWIRGPSAHPIFPLFCTSKLLGRAVLICFLHLIIIPFTLHSCNGCNQRPCDSFQWPNSIAIVFDLTATCDTN